VAGVQAADWEGKVRLEEKRYSEGGQSDMLIFGVRKYAQKQPKH